MKQRRWLTIAFIGFFLSRLIILKFPPPFYSDVFHDYRRYVHMWQDGLTPYLKHFYEYPPATIPVLYTPLLIKNLGLGHYYQNYRVQIFFFDLILFFFILQTLKKLKTKPLSKNISLAFYFLAPMIAKDFFYEGIDWIFIASLTIAIIYHSKRLLFWILFWLSTCIKFLTAPLAAVFLYFKKQNLLKELKTIILGFLIIWGLPLMIFKSALQVMFVFHQQRGIKYASFPGFIVETINSFTQSETRLDKAPDFQLQGPVSDLAEKIVALVFPLSIVLVLIYALFIILKPKLKNLQSSLKQLFLLKAINLKHLDPYTFSLKLALIYIFTIFFTAKIFSQPFHLWYIPLITLFPFKKLKTQLTFIFLALLLLIVDTTPWITLNEQLMVISQLRLKFFSYLFLRYLPMAALLVLSFKLPNK